MSNRTDAQIEAVEMPQKVAFVEGRAKGAMTPETVPHVVEAMRAEVRDTSEMMKNHPDSSHLETYWRTTQLWLSRLASALGVET